MPALLKEVTANDFVEYYEKKEAGFKQIVKNS